MLTLTWHPGTAVFKGSQEGNVCGQGLESARGGSPPWGQGTVGRLSSAVQHNRAAVGVTCKF